MATITPWEMRLVIDRNRSAFDGRPKLAAGTSLEAGLYWDPAAKQLVSYNARQTADRPLISVHPDPGASLDQVVRELAMGGGGLSGRPVPYEQAKALEGREHH